MNHFYKLSERYKSLANYLRNMFEMIKKNLVNYLQSVSQDKSVKNNRKDTKHNKIQPNDTKKGLGLRNKICPKYQTKHPHHFDLISRHY